MAAKVSPVLLANLDALIAACCKTRTFSRDKFSLIGVSTIFRTFNFHYSMPVLFYIITKVKILEAFNFHGFVSSAKIAKINR